MAGMTDREALEDLLHRFGLTPSDRKDDVDGNATTPDRVVLEAKVGGVAGYRGFCAVFEFDADGKFEALGLYE
jgi:hypothetical protein